MKKYIFGISLFIILLSGIFIFTQKDFKETELSIKNGDATITATKLQYEEDKNVEYQHKDIIEYKDQLESMNVSIKNTELYLEFNPSVIKNSKGFAVYIIEIQNNEVLNVPVNLDIIFLPEKAGEYVVDYIIFSQEDELVRYGFKVFIEE